MYCPKCEGGTCVIDVWFKHKQNMTHRRRECLTCHYRFTTHELIKTVTIENKIKTEGRDASQFSDIK